MMNLNYNEIFNTITKELGWQATASDSEHSDCEVENIVSYIRYKKFPALIPEMLRFSKLVTCGQMTRAEAQKKMAQSKITLKEPDNLEWFLNSFDINREEFNKILSNPLLHMEYIKKRNRIFRRLKSISNQILR